MFPTVLPATLYSGIVLEKYYILKIKTLGWCHKEVDITTSITISFTYINHKLIN